MSIERTYYCEGPDCSDSNARGNACHVSTATPPPHLPASFIEVRQREDGEDYLRHFCGWDCLMKFAAKQPLPIVIPWDEALGGDPDAA